MTDLNSNFQPEEELPVIPWQYFALILLGSAAGAAAALLLLPGWLPGLGSSFQGEAPKGFWYLSRASAGVAYTLLWLSMLVGLLITNKLARVWPGGPAAFELHQYFSLLGIAFALFHALILMGDRYIRFDLGRVLVPFSNPDYRPVWVGLGQVAFYLMLIVSLTFYARRRIGNWWRVIHYMSFALYLLALAHGLFSGTDAPLEWVRAFYWSTGGLTMFLVFVRILAARYKPAKPARQTVRRD